ncbi:MAG: hypothetical protein LBQ55_03005 [Treponema sp.]|jgi:hypothetical protein|nr:hypothetical protein [Treponema sp.]
MSYRSDFLPRKESEFDVWFRQFCTYVTQKCIPVPPATAPEWTHIPAARLTELNDSYMTWHAAYLATLKPHSPGQTLAKKEARKNSEGVIRRFVNEFIRYGPITDQEKLDSGCHVADGTRSPDTRPEGFPEVDEVDTSVIRVLTIHFKPVGTPSKAKPHKVHGAEIRWALLDAPPRSETELINSDFDTASPFTLTFHEEQRGKWVYFCLRWESTTNLKGDYGPIYSAVIP